MGQKSLDTFKAMREKNQSAISCQREYWQKAIKCLQNESHQSFSLLIIFQMPRFLITLPDEHILLRFYCLKETFSDTVYYPVLILTDIFSLLASLKLWIREVLEFLKVPTVSSLSLN